MASRMSGVGRRSVLAMVAVLMHSQLHQPESADGAG